MIKIVRRAVKKVLSAYGYKLTPASSKSVHFENFANLAIAYEMRLNGGDDSVRPNSLRPELLARLLGTPPSEAYFIIQALAKCKDVRGDVCEFGVAQGETSALIANEIVSFGEKTLHLFDSFEGLPSPGEMDNLKDDIFSLGSMDAYEGTMACSENMVRTRLSDISFPNARVNIHKGFIENIIHEEALLPGEVCFAYIDFDFYEPIWITLEYLNRVASVGSIIIVDDYNFFSTGVKLAVDNFMNSYGHDGAAYECMIPDTRYGHFAVITKKS